MSSNCSIVYRTPGKKSLRKKRQVPLMHLKPVDAVGMKTAADKVLRGFFPEGLCAILGKEEKGEGMTA